jgi:hypothetical protein
VVQAARPTRSRLIVAAAAALLWAALALAPAAGAGAFARVLAGVGIVSGLLVGAALVFGWEQLVPWALGLLGTEYAGGLFARGGGTDDAAPLYAAGLLLLGELVAWSAALRTRMTEEPPVLLLRLAAVCGAAAASVGVGGLLLGLSAADVGGGLGWAVVGTASAVGVVALVVRAARY